MRWLSFLSEDVRHHIREDTIIGIEEVADRLKILRADGQEVEYQHVCSVAWSREPRLDYWTVAVAKL